jgi:hypothetical protein
MPLPEEGGSLTFTKCIRAAFAAKEQPAGGSCLHAAHSTAVMWARNTHFGQIFLLHAQAF